MSFSLNPKLNRAEAAAKAHGCGPAMGGKRGPRGLLWLSHPSSLWKS